MDCAVKLVGEWRASEASLAWLLVHTRTEQEEEEEVMGWTGEGRTGRTDWIGWTKERRKRKLDQADKRKGKEWSPTDCLDLLDNLEIEF